MVSSAPTILPPRVQSQYIVEIETVIVMLWEKDENKRKRDWVDPYLRKTIKSIYLPTYLRNTNGICRTPNSI